MKPTITTDSKNRSNSAADARLKLLLPWAMKSRVDVTRVLRAVAATPERKDSAQ